jgi:transposase
VLNPRRISLEKFNAWAKAKLLPTDDVVIEATTNAWHIYDLVLPLANRVVVAHPPQVKWIAEARVKTDRHDVLRLSHLLAADLIPEVWVPPIPVRQLRSLMSHRQRLVSMGARARNHLHSLLHRYAIQAPQGKIFSQKHRAWWHTLDLPPTERMRVRHDLATIDQIDHQLQEIDQDLSRLSTTDPWADQVPFLLQLPGFGTIVTMTVLEGSISTSRTSPGFQQGCCGYRSQAARHCLATPHQTRSRSTCHRRQGRVQIHHVVLEAG